VRRQALAAKRNNRDSEVTPCSVPKSHVEAVQWEMTQTAGKEVGGNGQTKQDRIEALSGCEANLKRIRKKEKKHSLPDWSNPTELATYQNQRDSILNSGKKEGPGRVGVLRGPPLHRRDCELLSWEKPEA